MGLGGEDQVPVSASSEASESDSKGAEDEYIGDYQVIECLGEGGMGKVYRGKHRLTAAEVAIKVMHDTLALDDSFQKRFIREATLHEQNPHPNIAFVRHINIEPLALILNTLTATHSIPHRIKRFRSGHYTVFTFTLARESPDFLHAKGIVHRDIKPANIKINREGVPEVCWTLESPKT